MLSAKTVNSTDAAALTFKNVRQVEQIRCVLNLPVPSEDEQGSDSCASQGSKGKESSSTKSSQGSSALEHPHQGHHAIEALKLDIYWARRDFEKAILELSCDKKNGNRAKETRQEDGLSSADANPVADGQSAMGVGSGDQDQGTSLLNLPTNQEHQDLTPRARAGFKKLLRVSDLA